MVDMPDKTRFDSLEHSCRNFSNFNLKAINKNAWHRKIADKLLQFLSNFYNFVV